MKIRCYHGYAHKRCFPRRKGRLFRKKRKSSVRQIFSKERFGLFFDGLAAPRQGARCFLRNKIPRLERGCQSVYRYTQNRQTLLRQAKEAHGQKPTQRSQAVAFRAGDAECLNAASHALTGLRHTAGLEAAMICAAKSPVSNGESKEFAGCAANILFSRENGGCDTRGRQWKRRKTTRQFRSAFAFLGGAAQEAFLDACAPSVTPLQGSGIPPAWKRP